MHMNTYMRTTEQIQPWPYLPLTAWRFFRMRGADADPLQHSKPPLFLRNWRNGLKPTLHVERCNWRRSRYYDYDLHVVLGTWEI